MMIAAWSSQEHDEESGDYREVVNIQINGYRTMAHFGLSEPEAYELVEALSRILADGMVRMLHEDLGLTDPDDIPF